MVRNADEQDSVPNLAAQFIESLVLDQTLEREGRVNLDTTVRICAEVPDGLNALWEAGMVHRDVEPANILPDTTGKAYITDFGLAKDSDGTVLTRTGQPLGCFGRTSRTSLRMCPNAEQTPPLSSRRY